MTPPRSLGRLSAGLIVYRRRATPSPPEGLRTEVLIGHMGGPFWARKHEGAWSIPKGQVEAGEEPFTAAMREFREELGIAPPSEDIASWSDLGTVRQASGKVVHAWAIEADIDAAAIVPGLFEMEWPPRSGRMASFPELDRAVWTAVDEAARILVTAQRAFLARLPLDSTQKGPLT